jgi:hypothetical protein
MIYDNAKEHKLKKTYAENPNEAEGIKAPDFEAQQNAIDNFKQKDKFTFGDLKRY